MASMTYGNLPGARFRSRDMELAKQLIEDSENNGTLTSGLASMFKKGIAGWLMGEDTKKADAYNKALSEGLATPYSPAVEFKAADPGVSVEEIDLAPEEYETTRLATPEIQAREATSPIRGAQRSLRALLDAGPNERATQALLPLTMAQAGQDRAANLAEKTRLQNIADKKDLFQFQQENKVFAPKVAVPGRDIPFAPNVMSQKEKLAQLKNPSLGQFSQPSDKKGKQPKAIPRNPKTGKMILSEGQIQVDKDFGKIYTDFVAAGGLGDTSKNLSQLKGVLKKLKEGDTDLTGGVRAWVPDWAREKMDQESYNAQEAVEEVVQRNLRLILGAQFTNEEGKRLIARAYNPNLDEAVNAERLERLVNAMEVALKAKVSASKHFQKYGTLANYDGVGDFNINQIEDLAYGPNSMSNKQEKAVKRLKYNIKTGEFE